MFPMSPDYILFTHSIFCYLCSSCISFFIINKHFKKKKRFILAKLIFSIVFIETTSSTALIMFYVVTSVTEYSDTPENPGIGPNFTENMGLQVNMLPLTQGAEAYLSSGLFLTLEPSDNRTIYHSTFSLNITFCQFFM